MKRILGMVAAIAGVLALSSAASAALVVFDVSGSNGTTWSRSTDANAAIPGPPTYGGPCTPGMSSPPAPAGAGNDCFRYGFAPGSSITVDITGGVVTMVGGDIYINTFPNPTPLVFGTINLAVNTSTHIAGGATGTLVGDSILWSTPANVSASDSADILMCTGPNCGLISLPDGVPVPFDNPPSSPPAGIFSAISNSSGVTALNLGQWNLDPGHGTILASNLIVTRWSNVAELGNRRQGTFTLGAGTGLGQPAPEPGTAALILLGLGALALRSRKA
jgi:hypothetical protein